MVDFDKAFAYWRSRPRGIDMIVIASMTTQESFHTHSYLPPDARIAEPQAMWSHDPYTCASCSSAFVASRIDNYGHGMNCSAVTASAERNRTTFAVASAMSTTGVVMVEEGLAPDE